jgi:predicted lipid-binding transport protein (Tim44 family)
MGFGEELMSILLIVAGAFLVIFLVRLVMSRGRQPQAASANGAPLEAGQPAMMRQSSGEPALGSAPASMPPSAVSSSAPAMSAAPEGSPSAEEIERFLDVARDQFVQLQKVWDAGRIDDLRGFTTESMAEGLRQQLFQRGPSSNHTSVVELHAEWFGQARDTGEDGQPVEAVFIRFHGLIRESEEGLPTDFDETWTLHKSTLNPQSGWLLAGITQNRAQ